MAFYSSMCHQFTLQDLCRIVNINDFNDFKCAYIINEDINDFKCARLPFTNVRDLMKLDILLCCNNSQFKPLLAGRERWYGKTPSFQAFDV